MAQQMKNRFAKPNQHCEVTKINHKSQNNSILLQQLLNNGILLHLACNPAVVECSVCSFLV